MQVTLSGSLGEAEVGGPMLNIVPKTGGNTFKGTVFVSGAGAWAQGNNVDDELRAQGMAEAAGLHQAVGCQRRHRRADQARQAVVLRELSRLRATIRTSPGCTRNKFAGDASHWDYAPDLTCQRPHRDVQDDYARSA